MTEVKDLDEEFKQYVSDMKPHTKVLPYKSGLDERERLGFAILNNAHHISLFSLATRKGSLCDCMCVLCRGKA